MSNRYLQNTKFARAGRGESFGETASSWLSSVLPDWAPGSDAFNAKNPYSSENAQELRDKGYTVEAKPPKSENGWMSGKDDWARYFWNIQKNFVVYINPDTKIKTKATPAEYKYITTSPKVEWVPAKMDDIRIYNQHVNPKQPKARKRRYTPQASASPMPSSDPYFDEFSDQPKGDNQVVEHLKEKWVWYAGGAGVSLFAILAAKLLSSGSPNVLNDSLGDDFYDENALRPRGSASYLHINLPDEVAEWMVDTRHGGAIADDKTVLSSHYDFDEMMEEIEKQSKNEILSKEEIESKSMKEEKSDQTTMGILYSGTIKITTDTYVITIKFRHVDLRVIRHIRRFYNNIETKYQ